MQVQPGEGVESTDDAAVPLAPGDVAALLQLAIGVHRPAEPAAQKQELLNGICRLVGADSGVCAVLKLDRVSARWAIVSAVHASPGFPATRRKPRGGMPRIPSTQHQPDGPSVPALLDGLGDATGPAANGQLADVHQSITSIIPLAGLRLVASLRVGRRRDNPRPFAPHQRVMLNLLHRASRDLYRHDQLLAGAQLADLPPRQREVLQHLRTEKAIARQMRLSYNTVHHYVKALYRHFGVASRAELLAKWVA